MRGRWELGANLWILAVALTVYDAWGQGTKEEVAEHANTAEIGRAPREAKKTDSEPLLSFDHIVAAARGPDGLAAVSSQLTRSQVDPEPGLRDLVSCSSPVAQAASAELLWRLAQEDRLTDRLAALAAELLAHKDPVVAALAEWAIATRVGRENNGQEILWPRRDPPRWFSRWMELDPTFLLDCDYLRLAVVWHIHYDAKKLVSSAGSILRRAGGAASEIRNSDSVKVKSIVGRQLAKLESFQAQMAQLAVRSPQDLTAQRKLWLAMRHAARPIVLANPALDFDQMVFVKRHAAHSHRNITGSQYPWVHKPGGGICVKNGVEPTGDVREVLQGRIGPGHVHGVDLWWDADRVVFGYAKQPQWPPQYDTVGGNDVFLLRTDQEPTHIYEASLETKGLRQITDHAYWSDFEPTYCANGDIVFSSDRSGRSSECGKFSADHTVINIYALSADGSNLRRLSDNKDIDRYPHSLDNGLVAYTRWEYQERHFFEVHAIWSVRPDGTMSDAVFNQHMQAPYGLRDSRSVPGSWKLVSIATGHHTFAYGPVVVIDPHVGISHEDAIRIVTPHVLPQEGPMAGEPVPEGGVPDKGGVFQTPWALSDRCFLASYSHARPPSDTAGGQNANGFAIYFIDVHGNKELIHRDLIYSCSFPMPLKRRPKPTLLTDLTEPDSDEAVCYVNDVYSGLEGVPRGAVKYIRISQRVGWPLDDKIGAMRYIPGNAWEKRFGYWAWAPVRVIGTVPVEEDGSAYFKIPADAAIYFQALDGNHMELRRMRSHVTLQPGEVRGCLGCHESKPKTPDSHWLSPVALRKDPVTPQPPRWGSETLLGYEWLIQPILDQHCIRCHGHDEPKGNIDLSSTRTADGFYQSFRTLFGQSSDGRQGPALVSVSNRFDGSSISDPKQFGTFRSPLVDVIINDKLHRDEVNLSSDQWRALVTWIDANAPYHDSFFNRRPSEGDEPLRDIVPKLDIPSWGVLGQ